MTQMMLVAFVCLFLISKFELGFAQCAVNSYASGGTCLTCTLCNYNDGTFKERECTPTQDTACTKCSDVLDHCAFCSSAERCDRCESYAINDFVNGLMYCKLPDCNNDCFEGEYLVEYCGINPATNEQTLAKCAKCDTSCGDGSYISTPCGKEENVVCTECTEECGEGKFMTKECGVDSDIECQDCKPECEQGTFKTGDCQGDSDLQCSACKESCEEGFFMSAPCDALNDMQCTKCDEACADGLHLVAECTATSNIVCDLCAGECDPTEFMTSPCTETTNRVCETCTTCKDTEFMTTDCKETTDRECEACLTCELNEFMTEDCTETSNRKCEPCLETCQENEYIAVPCSETENTNCTQCTVCPEGSYLVSPCTATSDTVCKTCSPECETGSFVTEECTDTEDIKCQACTPQCNQGRFVKQNCSRAEDLICSVCLGECTIGENVTFGFNVSIGSKTVIQDHVVIKDNVVLGGESNVGRYVIVGGNVIVGELNSIKENAQISDRTTMKNNVKIGENSVIKEDCSVDENAQVEEGTVISDHVQLKKNTMVKKNSQIASDSIINEGSRVGEGVRLKKKMTLGENSQVGNRFSCGDEIQIGANAAIANDVTVEEVTDEDIEQLILEAEQKAGGNESEEARRRRRERIIREVREVDGVLLEDDVDIKENCRLGRGSYFGKGSTLHENVVVGNNVTVQDGSIIRAFSYIGKNSVLQKEVIVGKNSQFGVDQYLGDGVKIGENVLVMAGNTFGTNVVVKDNVHIKENNTFGNDVLIEESVKVADNINVDGGSKIGHNAVIENDVEAGATIPPFYPNIPEDEGLSMGAIIGIAVGGAVALLALVALLTWLCCRKTKKKEPKIPADIYENLRTKEQTALLKEVQGTPDDVIDPSMIIKEAVIGSGAFGIVYKGAVFHGDVFLPIAIKEVTAITPEAREEFFAESSIMRKLDHPNIVACAGICETEHANVYSIILEYMNMGDLQAHLKKRNEVLDPVSGQEKLHYCNQIVSGMAYLASKEIVHRDLAARNCMLSRSNYHYPILKVTDFGLSRHLEEDKQYYKMTTSTKLPLRWMALESIKEKKFSEKSDVWSCGVTFWEIFSDGNRPYGNRDIVSLISEIETGYRLPKPSEHDGMYDVMNACWNADVTERPTFTELRKLLDLQKTDPSLYSDAVSQRSYQDIVLIDSISGFEHSHKEINDQYRKTGKKKGKMPKPTNEYYLDQYVHRGDDISDDAQLQHEREFISESDDDLEQMEAGSLGNNMNNNNNNNYNINPDLENDYDSVRGTESQGSGSASGIRRNPNEPIYAVHGAANNSVPYESTSDINSQRLLLDSTSGDHLV